MRIGLDLDNTIIFYDEAFRNVAVGRGLLPPGFSGTKQQVRDAIRLLPDGETEWQRLQGYVYGKGLEHASLFPGVEPFLRAAKKQGAELFIVSHKTEFGHFDPDKVNLRDAAKAWLAQRGFFDELGMLEVNVFFAATRAEKVAKIAELQLDWFVDDLIEVYEEPGFPQQVKRVLFHASPTPAPQGHWQVCTDWHSIHAVVHGREWDVAERLAGKPVESVTHASGGGNSRIYKVVAEGQAFALKLYPTIDKDPRDRLGVEKKALQFFERHHMTCVPRWLAGEPPYALMQWIDGELATQPGMADIDASVAFLADIFRLSGMAAPEDMPMASEACLSGAEIMRQVRSRLMRLQGLAGGEPSLAAFLQKQFEPALVQRESAARDIYAREDQDFAAELPQVERCLIPADFGFHNAMRTPQGQLIFIDFEYFGWDDPVKLICDFLLHPAMNLNAAMRQRFLSGLLGGENSWRHSRFTALYPLFGLRWALILLNEFLPERWQARAFARGDTSWEDTKQRQLHKAAAMLAASATTGQGDYKLAL